MLPQVHESCVSGYYAGMYVCKTKLLCSAYKWRSCKANVNVPTQLSI